MRIPLFHVDTFASQPFAGNPAAVCPLGCWLDDTTLCKVAAENNLSETAFFVSRPDHGGSHPSGQHDPGHYDLRWFTPRGEVKLCGHATLASAYVLLSVLDAALDTVRFETRHSGTLTVRRDRGDEKLSMDFPAMFAKTCANPPEPVLRALAPAPSPSTILEVNETYILVYDHERPIRLLQPDFALMEQLHPYVVSVTAPGDHADFVSRYFKPSYGMPEDPVTGSVHCALAPYWADRLGKPDLYAQQLSERGGELWCEVAGSRVILKGHAVLTLRGSLVI